MARQSKAQKETVGCVMHEFKHGELTSHGRRVRNPKQAIAIGLREAGASNEESPRRNKRNLARTKARERHGETEQARRERRGAQGRNRRRGAARGSPTRAELYQEARRRNIPGRSRMNKQQLAKALRR